MQAPNTGTKDAVSWEWKSLMMLELEKDSYVVNNYHTYFSISYSL